MAPVLVWAEASVELLCRSMASASVLIGGGVVLIVFGINYWFVHLHCSKAFRAIRNSTLIPLEKTVIMPTVREAGPYCAHACERESDALLTYLAWHYPFFSLTLLGLASISIGFWIEPTIDVTYRIVPVVIEALYLAAFVIIAILKLITQAAIRRPSQLTLLNPLPGPRGVEANVTDADRPAWRNPGRQMFGGE